MNLSKHSTTTYIKLGLLLVWIVLTVIGLQEHVFWRDEVRALSIAKAAPSIFDLPSYLRNEGHPILWYLLLKAGYYVLNSNVVLPILALLFASINVLLVLFKSPFHWTIAALLIFGQYLLFEYNFIARNYGLAVTLMLAFAFFANQKSRPIIPLLLLVLVAQTNFYAMIFSFLLACGYVLEEFKPSNRKREILLGFVLVSLSCLGCFFLCLPSEESLVVTSFSVQDVSWLKIGDVGWGFDHLFDGFVMFKHGFKTTLLIAMLLLFYHKPKLLMLLYLSMVFLALFHLNVRPNYSQHHGIWLFFLVTLLWWQYPSIIKKWKSNAKSKWIMGIGVASVVFMLVQNNVRGYNNYVMHNRYHNSNADHLGQFLKTIDTPERVLITEPDYPMESVVYYYPKSFYIPREQKFGTYVMFTKANGSKLSLSDLMEINDSFAALGKKPLIISQWDLFSDLDTLYYSYGKLFIVDRSSTAIFKLNYQKIADFHNPIQTDESYYVYEKK